MLLVRVHPIPSFVPGDRHKKKLVCMYVCMYVCMSLEMINHAPLILYNEEQGHSEQDLVRQQQHKYNLRLGSELIYGSKH